MQFQSKEFVKILSLLFLSLNIFSNTINNFGQVGYIYTPSAYMLSENSLAFVADRNEPDRKIFFIASPYNWLDANIHYSDITGKEYGNGFKQSYKDKGFSFKIKIPYKFLDHDLAIGINDIAGTSYYGSEYVVATKKRNRFEYSIGMGWGFLNGGYAIRNPLIDFKGSFSTRNEYFSDRGGVVESNSFFSGKEAGILFGLSYDLSKQLKFIFERDPTSKDNKINFPDSKVNSNVGIMYTLNNLFIKTSVVRGNNFNLQIGWQDNFSEYNPNNVRKKRRKNLNNKELQERLAEHNIGLISIKNNKDKLKMSVRHNSYYNQNEVNDLVYFYSQDLEENTKSRYKEIIVSQYTKGMEIIRLKNQNNKKFTSKDEKFADDSTDSYTNIYQVIERYPIIRNSFSLRLRNYIAARESFYFGGILLENDNEIILDDNLIIIGNLKYSLFDNFDGLYIPPVNTYPAQVRSDQKKYLNELGKNLVIGRFELNHFSSINRRHFFRYSLGIFEEMFGGAGVDYLYHKEGSLFSFFAESYYIKKRDYKMNLSFLEYSNFYSKVGLNIREPKFNINFLLSFGEYLAGDKGYTFEVAKRLSNGVEFSAYFTRTDVTKEQFGEGSFDKGLRIVFPFSIFKNERNLTTFNYRPLTKDPGAQLIKSIDIRKDISRFRYY